MEAVIEPVVTTLTSLGVVLPAIGIMKVIFGAVLVLALATGLTLVLQKRRGKAKTAELTARILGWWIIFGFLTPVLFGPPVVGVIVLALIAFLALREYASIMPLRPADRWALALAYLAVPVQTFFIVTMEYGFFIILVPVYLFMILPVALVLMGETQRFIVSLGTLHWGVMMAVYALGHAAFLLMLPEMHNGPAAVGEGLGLLVLLFIITGGNDVSQYCWGKLLGKRKIVPQVSPNKTWEGFVGGVVTSALVAVLIAPILSPIEGWMAAALGAGLAAAAILGDVTVSAVKRDLGVKDTGTALPGHGGLLDRLDSTVFTAPLMFHVCRYFFYS